MPVCWGGGMQVAVREEGRDPGIRGPASAGGRGSACTPRGPRGEALQQGQERRRTGKAQPGVAQAASAVPGSGGEGEGVGAAPAPAVWGGAPVAPAGGRVGKGEQTPVPGRGAGSAAAAAATSQPGPRLPLPLAVSPRLYGDRIRSRAAPPPPRRSPRPFPALRSRRGVTWLPCQAPAPRRTGERPRRRAAPSTSTFVCLGDKRSLASVGALLPPGRLLPSSAELFQKCLLLAC